MDVVNLSSLFRVVQLLLRSERSERASEQQHKQDLKWYYDQNLHSLFSSYLGNRSAEYLPCQVLFENSNGKSGFFDRPCFLVLVVRHRSIKKRPGASKMSWH